MEVEHARVMSAARLCGGALLAAEPTHSLGCKWQVQHSLPLASLLERMLRGHGRVCVARCRRAQAVAWMHGFRFGIIE